MVGTSEALDREIYLTPLSHIYTELCYPTYYPQLGANLSKALRYHVPHLRSPGQPFAGQSSTSRSAIKAGKATFPRSTLALNVDASLVDVVLAVSDALSIDEFDALWLYQAFMTYADDVELPDELAASGSGSSGMRSILVERITLWYFAEAKAIPQLASAVIRAALDEQHYYHEDAVGVLQEVLDGKPEAYLKRLFGDFVAVGQKTIPKKDDLTWALHNLSIQSEILSALFLCIYQNICQPTPAAVSEGLLRGIITSGFGALLITNVHLVDASTEGSRLRLKIRDQLLIIAIDCLGLARVLDGANEPDETIAFSRDTIFSLDTFLDSQATVGPVAIVKLAWAALLRQLDQAYAPPTEDAPRYQSVASDVLKPSTAVFGLLTDLVAGPLLAPPTEIEDEAELDGSLLRDTIKVLLMATAELVNVEYLQDFAGYCDVWRSVFGKGSPEVSELLCTAFWEVDYRIESRRAVLDNARYPAHPQTLLDLLQSLSGSPDCAEYAFSYLAELSILTLELQTVDTALFEHRIDLDGVTSYVTTRPMRLPGGALISAGSSGLLLSKAGQQPRTLQFNVPGIDFGWSILMEILRTVAGGSRSAPEEDVFGVEKQLSLEDIGLGQLVAAQGLEIVTSALEFIRAVLRAPHLAPDLLQRLAPDQGDDHELFRILFGLLHQPADVVLGQGTQAIQLVATSIGIIEALCAPLPGVVMVSLRNAAFFGTSTKTVGSASAYLRHEIRQGSYDLTIAVLSLVETLIVQAATLAHSEHAKYMAELVLAAIRFVHVEVWSRYASWKYLDIRQRFIIGQTAAKIFTHIVSEPVFVNPLGLVSAYLVDVFIVAASPVTVVPIAIAVSSLQPLQQRLLNAKRVQDARAAKSSVLAVLTLAQALLRLKMRLAPERQTLLEATFFDNAAAADRQRLRGKVELIELVSDMAAAAVGAGDLEMVALDLMRTLLEAISLTTPKPSLVGHYKDPAVAADRLVNVVREAPEDIATTGWRLLASIVATQPGFAVLCVSGHRNHLDRSKAEPASESGALAVAVSRITEWESSWQEPKLLSAVLEFCVAVWTSMTETAPVPYRSNDAFWKSVIAIATAPLTPPQIAPVFQASTEAIELYSHRTQAKARAAYLLSLEEQGSAKTQLTSLFRAKGQLLPAVAAAISSSCDPELHAQNQAVLGKVSLDIQLLRTLGERFFGSGYLYDLPAIDGLLGSLSLDEREEYLLRVQALNLSWSVIDAEIALVKAWRRLCEVSSTRGDGMAARTSFDVACAIAQDIASETRRGEVMQAFQAERLVVLRVLLENAWDADIAVQQILPYLKSIIDSDVFSPLSSVRRQLKPATHLSIFQITYLALRRLSVEAIPFLHAALNLVTAASSDLIIYAMTGESDESLELAFAVLGQLIRPELKLAPSVWLDKMTEYNLLPRSMELIVSSQVANEAYPPYLRHVLDLHFALASSPAAERLATSGLMSAYSNNAIAALAEEGAISPLSVEFAGARHPTHEMWCSMLLVVNAVMGSMSSSSLYHFARAEVVPFIELCGGQFSRALEWEASQPLSTPVILELEQISLLFYSVAVALGDQADGVLATYATKSVVLLSNVQDALAHPNHMSSLLEASSQAERNLIETERPEGEADLLQGTMLPSMVQALLRVSQTITSTLVIWTKSYELMGDKLEAWPRHLVLQPSDASASSDPVGIVTDLAATVIDLHRRLGEKTEPAKSNLVIPGFDPKVASLYTGRILEASAVLSSSQVVMRTALGAEEAEVDEMKPRAAGPQDRGAQVLRELTSDLVSLLPRAQSALEEGGARGAEVIKAVQVFVGRHLVDRE